LGLRVGVVGTGRLGREHVRVLKRVPGVAHVACFDIVAEKSRHVAQEFGAEACSSLGELLRTVDAVSVVVPTTFHAEVSLEALASGKNVFLEKPIAATVSEAERIIAASNASDRILQIGHIERFNAAVRAALPHIDTPTFVEIHRLAPFTVRGIDVSVIMDLMIHDIDLLGLFVGEDPVDIRAKGAGVLTGSPDIVNARLEYRDGCVANMTASRVSLEPLRKVRVFSRSGYLSLDLMRGEIRHLAKKDSFEEGVARLREGGAAGAVSLLDFVEFQQAQVKGEEPLYEELHAFCQTVVRGDRPAVTGEDGLRALRIAAQIQAIVQSGQA
jgi:predicted dehydrogenase